MDFCKSEQKSMLVAALLTHNDCSAFWGAKLVPIGGLDTKLISCLESNLGDMSARRRLASWKHLWGWGQPLDFYNEQFGQGQDLSLSTCSGFSWWDSWVARLKTMHMLWVFHRHLHVNCNDRFPWRQESPQGLAPQSPGLLGGLRDGMGVS